LDNAEARYLINDVSLKHQIPWVYGGAITTSGMTMTFIPGETPCFRCISPTMPSQDVATCETAGIVGTVPAIIGAMQATEAIKIIVNSQEINRDLIFIDVWSGVYDHFKVNRQDNCPACVGGQYDFLEQHFTEKVTSLCGQSRSVQVLDTTVKNIVLDELAAKLGKDVSGISCKKYMLSFRAGEQEMLVFPDGRAIVKNTIDASQAKQLYRRYVKANV
jgi:adenylyltransferase/sulfurtransferase